MTGAPPPGRASRENRRVGRRPRRHRLLAVTVALASLLFVALGVWQLQRLGEVRARNAVLEQRMDAPPVADTDLTAAGGADRVAELAFRSVELAGSYDRSEQILVRSRQHNGHDGFHVVTPLRMDGQPAVLVNRGWIPAGVDAEPAVDATAPDGRVRVTGILRPSEDPPALFGARDPAEGRLERAFRVDVERIARQLPYRVAPLWLALQDQQPPAGRFPIPVPPPQPDAGPHLSYAIQWFSFALIAVVGYVAYRRRTHAAA